jgi:hypothetical protein
MTPEQILSAINKYEKLLENLGDTPLESKHDNRCCQSTATAHLLTMIPKMREFISQNKLEKAFRWLGFIQGVLWFEGLYTLDELKNDNRQIS